MNSLPNQLPEGVSNDVPENDVSENASPQNPSAEIPPQENNLVASNLAPSNFTPATLTPTPLFPPPVPLQPLASDPAWNGWDVLRIAAVTIVALIVCVVAVLFAARIWIYPHSELGEIARNPLAVVVAQSFAYVLVFAYMYVLVTRERRQPRFFATIHWNWPRNILGFIVLGFVLSFTLQVFASRFLPIPKELPIDNFFRTPAEAWALGVLSITLAPLMEELFFRGFLYPVLARRLGLPIAVILTGLGFAALHGSQLMFSWGPVLVIFLVGIVLTLVRAKTNSVAAGVLVHMAYNGTITIAMFAATDGFRHLEKLHP